MEWDAEALAREANARALRWGRARAFALTFLSYMCFHLTRKVSSVTKGALHPQSSAGKSSYDPQDNPGWAPFNQDLVPLKVSQAGYVVSESRTGIDGDFKCAGAFDKDAPCTAYVRHGDKVDVGHIWLALLPSDQITGLECPLGWGTCWALARVAEPQPRRNGSTTGSVLFAQDTNGPLPAVPSSKNGDQVQWHRADEAGGFAVDKTIKVKPDLTDGGVLLGSLDSVFLGFYTVGLFVSGYLGDRVDLRLFLLLGMGGSAVCMFLMAFAYSWHIHSMTYFVLVNAMFGLLQSIGWPSVVAVMGSWFGHGSRGFVMGMWNSHTSLGNILGSVITAASVGAGMHHEDWPLGYAVPGLVMMVSAVIVFSFLQPHPRDAGLVGPDSSWTEAGSGQIEEDARSELSYEYRSAHELDASAGRPAPPGRDGDLDTPLLREARDEGEGEAPLRAHAGLGETLMAVARIPGLIPFSVSLMFSKMCAYSLLYWGPYYLTSVGFTSEEAGYLCSFFDIGGVLGGIVAGYLSDRIGARGVVAFGFQVIGVPVMAYYYAETEAVGNRVGPNVALMILVGFFINAPYALITTAVAADLGTQVKGNDRLLSLVTGIIDGTGSFGAMVQGVVVGWISTSSWASVWHFLMVAQSLSALMLARLVYREAKDMWGRRRVVAASGGRGAQEQET